ncbi:MAG: aldo/keto reductase [SAR202 cluster bacterium Io17-Chloro-G7]|nr:MAG: aldo/keto reductase [SAR202 cluster bacterium Io17-Chloro-G7]
MEKRVLGNTGLSVTVLGFGAMELRGPGSAIRNGRPVDAAQAEKVLNGALDGGINLVDTSIDYGSSEELIGKYISHRRQEYLLASKCGCNVDVKGVEAGTVERHIYTRQNIVDGVELSLKRLKTDYLDLLQFHGAPPHEMRDEAIQALVDMKKDGKARFIGVSDVLPEVSSLLYLGVFDAFQFPYSVMEQEHEAFMSQAAKAGAGTIIRGGIARGEPGHGLADPDRWAIWEKAKLGELLDGMDQFEFLLRYTISHPDLNTTIIGTLDAEHAAKNIAAAANGPLPSTTYEEANRRLAAVANQSA